METALLERICIIVGVCVFFFFVSPCSERWGYVLFMFCDDKNQVVTAFFACQEDGSMHALPVKDWSTITRPDVALSRIVWRTSLNFQREHLC